MKGAVERCGFDARKQLAADFPLTGHRNFWGQVVLEE